MDSANNNTESRTLEHGETREVGTVRFHMYRDGLKVTDLTNAGKRGKTVNELYVDQKWRVDRAWADLYNLAQLVCSVPNYETVAALVECFVDEHESTLNTHTRTHKGIEVPPATFEEICISNEHMCLTAGYDSFGVSDKRDQANAPRIIPTCHDGKKTAVKRFYALVKANRKAFETMTFSEVWTAASEAKVRVHYYCSND